MMVRGTGKALLLVGTLLSIGMATPFSVAEAARPTSKPAAHAVATRSAGPGRVSVDRGADRGYERVSHRSVERGADRGQVRTSDRRSKSAERAERLADRRFDDRRFDRGHRGGFDRFAAADRYGLRFAAPRKGGKSRYDAPIIAAVSRAPAIALAPSYSAPAFSAPSFNAPNDIGENYAYNDNRGMSCVPFARMNSGIEVAGNAGDWWANAAGTYERGSRPEVGSVMSFRSTGRMPLGHVAVVSRLVGTRLVEIDHSNWGSKGRVQRNVRVVDVSENNDWSAVRVALGRTGDFGSVYPTHGFIYDRPDRGMMVANNAAVPGAPGVMRITARTSLLSAAPADQFEEVAEAPDEAPAARRTYARRYKPVSYRVTTSRYGYSRY